jgi:hypothetical protein
MKTTGDVAPAEPPCANRLSRQLDVTDVQGAYEQTARYDTIYF